VRRGERRSAVEDRLELSNDMVVQEVMDVNSNLNSGNESGPAAYATESGQASSKAAAQRSANLESNFNLDLASDGSAVGPISGLKPPVLDRLKGLPFQSRARPVHYLDVFRSAVRSYDNS